MLTFMPIASMLGRPTNTYNTLAASAFLLLFSNPMILFVVGFQLSYLAVFGIVYLQPRIYRLLTPNHWFFDKLWLLTSVSLSAQIATTPLSIYYFHQFPTYFLVANWIVIPAASVIVCLGLIVLITSFWTSFNILSAWLLEIVVSSVNVFIDNVQKLPYSLVGPIYLHTSTVLLLYGLLVLWFIFLHTKKMKYLIAISVVAMFLSLYTMREYLSHHTQCSVIFYSIDHHQVIAFVKSFHSALCIDSRFEVPSEQYDYHVRPSQIALGIKSSDICMLEEEVQNKGFPMQTWYWLKVAVWHGKKFIIINNMKNLPYLDKKIYTDFLVVEENSVTTLKPLLERFDMGMLVIGTSNRRFLTRKLQREATQHSLGTHSLLEQGALTVSW